MTEVPGEPRRGTPSRRTFLRLIVLGVGGSVLAACTTPTAVPTATTAPASKPPAPPPAASPAAVASPAAKPAASPSAAASPVAVDMAPIEAAARREGAVTLYSSFNLDEFDKIYPLFQARYPEVKVDHVRGNGEQLVQRLITETRGGRTLADVLETNSFDVFNTINEKLLEPWVAPNSLIYPESIKDAAGFWVSTRQNIDCVAWNTNLVKPGEEPKTYDDLTDPKWSGRIIIEADDMEMFAGLLSGRFGGNLERATDWLKKVAANKPEPFKGHTEIVDLLSAGQGAVFFGAYAHRIEAQKAKRAPVDWMKSEAAQLLQVGGIIKGGPHPNAARLFLNWLLGEEGQEAISKVGRVPSRPGVKLEADLLPAGIKLYPARPEMALQYQQLTKVWKETLGIQ